MASRQLTQKEADIQMMLAAHVHLGTKNCDFQMERYIFKRRSDGNRLLFFVLLSLLILWVLLNLRGKFGILLSGECNWEIIIWEIFFFFWGYCDYRSVDGFGSYCFSFIFFLVMSASVSYTFALNVIMVGIGIVLYFLV